MTVWIDAHLSPALARWMSRNLGVDAYHVEDLDLRDSPDSDIFDAARKWGAIVVTKDRDFVELVRRRGPPPAIIWLTCGNTSTKALTGILSVTFGMARQLLEAGEAIVEIRR